MNRSTQLIILIFSIVFLLFIGLRLDSCKNAGFSSNSSRDSTEALIDSMNKLKEKYSILKSSYEQQFDILNQIADKNQDGIDIEEMLEKYINDMDLVIRKIDDAPSMVLEMYDKWSDQYHVLKNLVPATGKIIKIIENNTNTGTGESNNTNQQEIKDYKEELRRTKEELKRTKTDLVNMTIERDRYKQEAENYKQEAEKARNLIKEQKDKIAILESENKEWRDKFSNLDTIIVSLGGPGSSVNPTTFNKIKSSMDSLNTLIVDQEEAIRTEKEKLKKLEEDIEDKKKIPSIRAYFLYKEGSNRKEIRAFLKKEGLSNRYYRYFKKKKPKLYIELVIPEIFNNGPQKKGTIIIEDSKSIEIEVITNKPLTSPLAQFDLLKGNIKHDEVYTIKVIDENGKNMLENGNYEFEIKKEK